MKYILEQVKDIPPDDRDFIPFVLGLHFETREDYVNFHDKVLINKESSLRNVEFIGKFFKMGHNSIKTAKGEISYEGE